jgi:molecular chaperone Hsp33
MNDYLVKALAFDDQVRIYCVRSTNTVNAIGTRLNYYPSALAAVGRVVSVSLMMGAMLKNDETVTVKVEGNGPIGKIVVDADAKGHVRAYCDNPHVHFEYADMAKLNVRATVGDTGFINVIKDLKMREPFIGSTPIINGELAEDFAYYFNISEQDPSAVSLGVLVNTDNSALAAGGFIIQLLPFASESIVNQLEETISKIPTMSSMLNNGESCEDIITRITGGNHKILETMPVEFRCNCSRERFERGLLSLGSIEIKAIIDEDQKADTVCHFCGNTYHFDKEELEALYQEALNKEKGEHTNG